MSNSEPDLQIDVNKITAYLIMLTAKDAITAITAKLKKAEESEHVAGWIETNKLKPFKGLEKAILVLLPIYPGLFEVFQDEDLRKNLLLHDTKGGLIFCTPAIKNYFASARISHISGIIKEIETAEIVLNQAFLLGSYGGSINQLFNELRSILEPDFAQLIEYRFQNIQEQVNSAGIRELINLQIPVDGFYSRLAAAFRQIAISASDCVDLGLKFINKANQDEIIRRKDKILQTSSTGINALTTIIGLCDKHNRNESYRLNGASFKLKELERHLTAA